MARALPPFIIPTPAQHPDKEEYIVPCFGALEEPQQSLGLDWVRANGLDPARISSNGCSLVREKGKWWLRYKEFEEPRRIIGSPPNPSEYAGKWLAQEVTQPPAELFQPKGDHR